jgi:hypothetical protein
MKVLAVTAYVIFLFAHLFPNCYYPLILYEEVTMLDVPMA